MEREYEKVLCSCLSHGKWEIENGEMRENEEREKKGCKERDSLSETVKQ